LIQKAELHQSSSGVRGTGRIIYYTSSACMVTCLDICQRSCHRTGTTPAVAAAATTALRDAGSASHLMVMDPANFEWVYRGDSCMHGRSTGEWRWAMFKNFVE